MNENDLTTTNWAARTARAEHGELHQLLDAVRKQICGCLSHENKPDKQQNCLNKTMEQLRDHIETHFAHEENGGWLEEAVAQAPFLAHQLTLLERQHGPLREQANQLVTLAGKVKDDTGVAEMVKHEFEAFVGALVTHEAEEERILCKGLNEDLDLE